MEVHILLWETLKRIKDITVDEINFMRKLTFNTYNISKIIALFLFTLGFSACTDNFEEYNTNKYAVYKGVPSVLLPAMMEPLMFCSAKQFADDRPNGGSIRRLYDLLEPMGWTKLRYL